MTGYSGTALYKKLGIKPQFRVALHRLPSDVKAELKPALESCRIVPYRRGTLDFGIIFVKSQVEMRKEFSDVAKQLAPAGMLWVSWPKKSSGVTTDLVEDEVRRIGLEAGLVDVKVCAVNEVWSGLKFVIRLKDRPGSKSLSG